MKQALNLKKMRLLFLKRHLFLLDQIPIKLRLSLVFGAIMAIILTVIGWGLYRIVEQNLYESVDASLLATANSIRDSRSIEDLAPNALDGFLEDVFGERYVRAYAQLLDLSGKVYARTSHFEVTLPVTPKAYVRAENGLLTYETFTSKGRAPIRQLTLPVMKNGQFCRELVQIGASLDSVYHTLQNISRVLWACLPVGLIISMIFGYLVTSRSLKPVRIMTKAAANLDPDDLSFRIPLPRAKDELRQLALTFNEMLARLQDTFGRLQRFSADVSHELRTSIAVLKGEAEFSLRKPRSSSEYQKSLEAIKEEAIHMTNIVENLLLFAKAESGTVPIKKELIPLSDFIVDVSELVKNVFLEHKVHLKIENFGPENFLASETYIGLALKNILINAAKHSPKEADVILRIAVDPQNKFLSFKVIDKGEGIEEKMIPYIFDPFFRIDSARNRQTGGYGIGLSLAKSLVRLHGGSIKVSSKLQHGSTFEILLPL